ncbi:MAG: hypothetical protein CBC38_01420 [Gammaproteobacteria bacterium TMED78]|nr:MAG: hypothetical protein CBC38_01420 [Gammaproteobacteria bacterium TMED78]|tara:strand:+ start:395 stop:712 length:318 start_codon:yes stop_codon:yes gene_type:complete
MPNIIFKQIDGSQEEIEIEAGYTIMEGGTINNVSGIEAECGGACSCATCHVYINPEWQSKIPAMDSLENEMLEVAKDRLSSSRLSCQINVTEDMDGLVLTVVPPY